MTSLKCPQRYTAACTCDGSCPSGIACVCPQCTAAYSAGHLPAGTFTTPGASIPVTSAGGLPPGWNGPRGSGSGMTGFAEDGAQEIEFAAGTVTGLRQWTLDGPDFANDPHQAELNWKNAYLKGATGYRWPSGTQLAVCNNDKKHVPPTDVDPATGGRCGCVSPETRVLTADLHWVPAGDLVIGERLVAFDEHHNPELGKSSGRRYRDAVVANTERGKLPCYDLRFEDGTTVRVSADHRWLCYSGDKGAHWVRTDELRAGELRASHVVKPFAPWETDLSREAGYLAGALDGEGSLTQVKEGYAFRVSFAQADNEMLTETERCLKELGIRYNHYAQLRSYQSLRLDGTPRLDMHRLTVAGKPDLMRLLGSVRPVRLLPKFQPGQLGRLNMASRVRVIEKTYVGEREVVMLGTTAGTYFAEGLASHNCGFWAYWNMASLGANRSMGSTSGLPVLGVIEGFGRVMLGTKGFRSQKARLVALAPAFSIQAEVKPPNPYSFAAEQAQRNGEEEAEIRARAQQHADAWMAVIQDRLGAMYPGAQVFATVNGLLASVKIHGKP